jgi:hypothetical protein
VAHCAAQLLRFELVTESRLSHWMIEEFGETPVPERAWRPAAISVLARMAREHHLVIARDGAESLFSSMPLMLRARVVTPPRRRAGLGRVTTRAKAFDIVLNAEQMDIGQMAEVLHAAVVARGLVEKGLLSATAESELQFRMRLQLARYGIVPAGRAHLKGVAFGHPSEELFANLLDFYRIPWEYEPRSFPLQWNKDGRVTEAFTPDFYLPESDLYVELTTMKQALVTRKNRKVKLLRAIYPHINIQVFYQKDFQDLVSKYGLRMAAS